MNTKKLLHPQKCSNLIKSTLPTQTHQRSTFSGFQFAFNEIHNPVTNIQMQCCTKISDPFGGCLGFIGTATNLLTQLLSAFN